MAISEEQVTFRLPKDLVERADALIEILGQTPEYRALRLTRSVVLRLAIDGGLEQLEARLGVNGKRKAAGGRKR